MLDTGNLRYRLSDPVFLTSLAFANPTEITESRGKEQRQPAHTFSIFKGNSSRQESVTAEMITTLGDPPTSSRHTGGTLQNLRNSHRIFTPGIKLA